MIVDLARMLVIARTLSDDFHVTVRPGPATRYLVGPAVIEFAEEVLEWPEEEVLAVMAHEGAHHRNSVFVDLLPAKVMRRDDEVAAINLLEDGRIHQWIRRHWPGMRSGIVSLDRRAYASVEAAEMPDSDGSGAIVTPPQWVFLWKLRAVATGMDWTHPDEAAVLPSVNRCLAAAHRALHAYPQREPAAPRGYRSHAETFVQAVLKTVLPEYRRLRDRHEARQRRKGVSKHLLVEAAVRAQDAGRSPDAWRGWIDDSQRRKTRQQQRDDNRRSRHGGAAGARVGGRVARLPRGQGSGAPASAVPEAYQETAGPNEAAIHTFTEQLHQALARNEEPYLEGGYPTGRRPDLKRVFLSMGNPRLRDQVWRRPNTPEERCYRLALLADLSSSMEGAPMASLARSVIICLEAAERIGIPTMLAFFGGGAEPLGAELVKDLAQPLCARRDTITQRLLTSPQLGSETPLVAGLDRVRTALWPPVDGTDLVVVITDGKPRACEEKFYSHPTKFGSRDDKGCAGESSVKAGRVRIWIDDAAYARRTREAVGRLEQVQNVELFGVGIGLDAPVDEHFSSWRRYEDHEQFAREFPRFVRDRLLAAVSA